MQDSASGTLHFPKLAMLESGLIEDRALFANRSLGAPLLDAKVFWICFPDL